MNWQKIVFWFLLLCLPLNLGKHWILPFSYVRGLLVDYLVPTLYATDIPLVLLGLAAVGGGRSRRLGGLGRWGGFWIFLFFALLSGLAAPLPRVFWWRWVKLLFYILFIFWVKENFSWEKDWRLFFWVLVLPALGESLLALFQWWQQSSVFGYLPFGGPVYRAGQPGLATVAFWGAQRVRSYGTFPHPNALGGYLAVVLVWAVWGIWKRREVRGIGRWLVTGLLMVGLGLTFSRSVWWVAALGVAIILGQPFLAGLLLGGGGWHLAHQLAGISWQRRAGLLTAAWEMVKSSPLLGVGLGQFTVVLENFYQTSELIRFVQPVHNLYLLVVAEVGVLGGLGFLLGVVSLVRRLLAKASATFFLPLAVSLGSILVLGLVDHYWWTLPQTSLIFWLTLGLVASYTKADQR